MLYGFDTDIQEEAIASLIIYSIYKSRDINKFKVTPDMWGVIERSVKSCATSSANLKSFIECLKIKLHCSTIKISTFSLNTPMDEIVIDIGEGHLIGKTPTKDFRFLKLLDGSVVDVKNVLKCLKNYTTFLILLVRNRLEIDKMKGVSDEE